MAKPTLNGFRVFSTCPSSQGVTPTEYAETVARVARWSEAAGCEGILVYTDNGLVDPWLVSQLVVQATERLSPLVAVQPVYLHPYAVAKMVSSFGFLHGRRLWLNMVAGGFRNDLLALGDTTEHDKRYDRLVEYTAIIQGLLRDGNAVNLDGEFYRVAHLKLQPRLPEDLYPGFTISGSSDAGLDAARRLDAIAIQYPKSLSDYAGEAPTVGVDSGIRVGIIARPSSADAWTIARTRFPEDRRGQLQHQLAARVSDSVWHRQLAELGRSPGVYWLTPFENYKTFCPYLVGSYEEVAAEVAGYLALGYRAFILDIPRAAEDLKHTAHAFNLAGRQVRV